MTVPIRICVASVLLAALAGARTAPAQAGPRTDPAGFRADVDYLSSEKLGGRGAGTPGGARAIAHLETRMRELGLKRLRGLTRGRVQQFVARDPRPRTYRADGTGLSLVVCGEAEELELTRQVLPFGGSGDGRVEAPVVFAGYGLRIKELRHDDYANLDVQGKVVLVLRGAPDWREPGSKFRAHRQALHFETKMENARARGAVGFLLCNRRARSKPSGGGEDISNALLALGAADIPSMWITVETAERLLSADGRNGSGPVRLAKALPPHGELQDCAVRMRVDMGPPRPALETANVVGLLVGRDPKLARQFLVVAAHHDHLGRGSFGSLGGPAAVGQVHPGAG